MCKIYVFVTESYVIAAYFRLADAFVSVLCVIGNKCDLSNSRLVSKETGKDYASLINAHYCETSALTGEGKGPLS